MREIKFRYYSQHRHKMYSDLTINCGLGNKDLIGLNQPLKDIVENKRGANHEAHVEYIIMQYTGLKDKKRTEKYPEGQEIYEGDILKDSCGNLWKIVWMNERAHFSGLHNRTPSVAQLYIFNEISEIIGNIYENSGLLGETK